MAEKKKAGAVPMTKNDHGTICHANVPADQVEIWEAQGWEKQPASKS